MSDSEGSYTRTFQTAILEFTVYSFIGWSYETVLTSAVQGSFADRGLLRLPVCPIYGFSALLVLMLLKGIKNPAAIFFVGGAALTLTELAASYLLEAVGLSLWDYNGWAFNFQGRIALVSSLIFAALCLLLVKLLHPLLGRLFARLSFGTLTAVSALLLAAMLLDLITVLI